MKNIKMSFYTNAYPVLHTSRLIYKSPESAPKAQESKEDEGYAVDRKEKERKAEIIKGAEWMVGHLKKTDFGSDEKNKSAKKYGENLAYALKEGDFNLIDRKLMDAKGFVEKIRAEEQDLRYAEELVNIKSQANEKWKTAIAHFKSLNRDAQTPESYEKVLKDYMYSWWNALSDDQRGVAMSSREEYRLYHNERCYAGRLRDDESISATLTFGGRGDDRKLVLNVF
jgi:hypothetical protein